MEYLLSPMVGFAKSEVLCYPHHQNKGFQRYIYIYTKSTMFPSERVECPPTPSTKEQERTDPLENCSSFRLEEEEVIPTPSLKSGSSNCGEEQEEVVVYVNGNGCDDSPSKLREERRNAASSSPQLHENGEDSVSSTAESRVSGALLEDEEDSRISGFPPTEEVANSVYLNGLESSPNNSIENGIAAAVNGEEENSSRDNT